MDKFINTNSTANNGLDLIKINNLKVELDELHKTNRHYNDILGEFKRTIIKKINNFDPIQRKDSYDTFLLNMWLFFIMGNKTKKEYIDIFKLLGLEVNNYEDNCYIDKAASLST